MMYNLTFVVNDKCNLKCEYCFEKKYNTNKNEITQKTIDEIIVFLNKYISNKKNIEINILGGEPLLSLDKVMYILESLEKSEFKDRLFIKLFTNGTIFNDKVVSVLKKINSFKNHRITIVKDCYPELQFKKNSYNLIKNNIELFKKYVKNILTYNLLTKETIKHIKEILQYKLENNEYTDFFQLEYLREKNNIDYEDFNFIIDSVLKIKKENNLTDEQTNKLFALFSDEIILEKNPTNYLKSLSSEEQRCKCYGGVKHFYVRYDGVIFPCDRLLDNEFMKNQKLPNIKNVLDDIETLRKNEIFDFLSKNKELDMSELGYKCSECIFKTNCKTCRIESYIKDKDSLIKHSKEKCNRTLDKNKAILEFYLKNTEKEIKSRINFKNELFKIWGEKIGELL